MKKPILIIFTIILILSTFQHVLALGLTPSSYRLDYVPGKTYTRTISVSQIGDMDYEPVVRGSYVEYATVEKVPPNKIKLTFTMPENAKPGNHQLQVGVNQIPKKEYGRPQTSGLTATVAVFTIVRFSVPMPEKYAELSLKTSDVEVGEVAYFTLNFDNKGIENITYVSGNISILDSQNITVATVPLTPRNNILSMQNTELYAEWDTSGQKAGIYRAIASVQYDEKHDTIESVLRLGSMFVEIINVRAFNTIKDEIVKIDVDVQSMWNEPIPNVYAQYIIRAGGAKLADINSPSITLSPWAKKTLTAYWDTKGLDVGVYDAEVIVHYGQNTTTTNSQIYITEKETGVSKKPLTGFYLAIVLLIIAILFLAIVLVWSSAKKRKQEV